MLRLPVDGRLTQLASRTTIGSRFPSGRPIKRTRDSRRNDYYRSFGVRYGHTPWSYLSRIPAASHPPPKRSRSPRNHSSRLKRPCCSPGPASPAPNTDPKAQPQTHHQRAKAQTANLWFAAAQPDGPHLACRALAHASTAVTPVVGCARPMCSPGAIPNHVAGTVHACAQVAVF